MHCVLHLVPSPQRAYASACAQVADFIEAFVRRRLYWGATRFLLLDLCSGAGSVLRGMRSYQRRKEWTGKAWEEDGGYPSCSPTLAYVSVDNNPAAGADFEMDLTSANLREVIATALSHVGWEDGPNVAVLCWAVRAPTTPIARALVLALTPHGCTPAATVPPMRVVFPLYARHALLRAVWGASTHVPPGGVRPRGRAPRRHRPPFRRPCGEPGWPAPAATPAVRVDDQGVAVGAVAPP